MAVKQCAIILESSARNAERAVTHASRVLANVVMMSV